jgi:hypothetical protein
MSLQIMFQWRRQSMLCPYQMTRFVLTNEDDKGEKRSVPWKRTIENCTNRTSNDLIILGSWNTTLDHTKTREPSAMKKPINQRQQAKPTGPAGISSLVVNARASQLKVKTAADTSRPMRSHSTALNRRRILISVIREALELVEDDHDDNCW